MVLIILSEDIMDEPILVVISLTMFVGSYFAGCIPLFFTLSEKRIRIASVFGAGLLVGTAFCVIIPEGISSLAESSSANFVKGDLIRLNSQMADIDHSNSNKQNGGRSGNAVEEVEKHKSTVNEARDEERRRKDILQEGVPAVAGGAQRGMEDFTKIEKKSEPKQGSHHRDNLFEQLNGVIGVSVLVGFLFMHVIDQLSKMSHSRHKGVPTLGLVIHAFADGIAMGSASSAGSQMELQILVFIAIMLHKAPTAFALISILLASGLDKARVRRHLLIFSLSAPIGTVLTYAFLHNLSTASIVESEEVPTRFTGIILLFSAGTFLYIATVHVLPELIDSKCSMGSGVMSESREMLLGGGEKSSSSTPSARFSLSELCLFCASALIPAFISSATHGRHGH